MWSDVNDLVADALRADERVQGIEACVRDGSLSSSAAAERILAIIGLERVRVERNSAVEGSTLREITAENNDESGCGD